MLKWLKNYERTFEDGSGNTKISKGKIHEYLGMTLAFSEPGEVKITMIPYTEETVKYLPSTMKL